MVVILQDIAVDVSADCMLFSYNVHIWSHIHVHGNGPSSLEDCLGDYEEFSAGKPLEGQVVQYEDEQI